MKKHLFNLGCIIFLMLPLLAQVKPVMPSRPDNLRFSENKGQWDKRVQFKSNIPDGEIYLEKNSFFFMLFSEKDLASVRHPSKVEHAIIHGHSFKEEFVGCNAQPQISGESAYLDYENYFHGNDRSKWAGGVRIFPKIRYGNLYDSIDLVITGRGEAQLKYNFEVRPGADAAQIKIQYTGIDKMQLSQGQLQMFTSVGKMMEEKPYAYQIIDNAEKEVACNFALNGNQLGFDFPAGYNHQYPLVIDPTIVFSTFTGAIADNWGYTSTYDAQGDMYLAGLVNAGPPYPYTGLPSPYYTTPGAFQSVWGGGNDTTGIQWSCDMGVSKFSPDGSMLLYRTFIGGSNNETPNSLVADLQDNLVIYGVSYSSDFPVTSNAYSQTNHGDADIVVVKLNAAGSALLGSTYIGGSASDGINYDPSEDNPGNLKRNYGDQNRGEVNIDGQNNIYVASCTTSPDFPTTSDAVQTGLGGGQDGCVFKLNSDCSQLIWCTYLGGSSDDACYTLDLGPLGSVYVGGGTMSSNFPTTAGTINTTYQGGQFDGFVTRINASGTQLLSSTYVGTSGDDQVYCVKLDNDSNVYFMGQTNGQYPVKNAAYSNPNSGQFIVKIKPGLDSVFYSTVFGNGDSVPNISPTAFLVDTCQNVYVAGWGTSDNIFTNEFSPIYANPMYNMPLTPDAFQSTTDGTDFYFFVLEKDAQSQLFGSYFGGNGYIDHVDGGTSRFDKRGVMYEAICAGCGSNSLTPTTPGAWSRVNDSWNCNELGLKIAFNLGGPSVAVNAYPRATGCVPLKVQFQSNGSDVLYYYWYFGDGDSASTPNPIHTFTDTGNYNVMLIGYNPKACRQYDTAYVSVSVRNDSLTADFLPSSVVNCDSSRATFVTHDYSTTQYVWTLGDGTTSSTDSFTHHYANPGNYTVTLVVSDTSKCNLRDTFSTVIKIPPRLSATFTTSGTGGCIPYTVNFTTQNDPNAHYYWNFGNGVTSPPDTPYVSHTFTSADSFQIQLVVIDSASCNITDTAHALIVTLDAIANASFNFTRKFFQCDSAQIIASSISPGAPYQLWTFGDGTQALNVDSVKHTYTTAGTFVLTHVIYDSADVCKPYDTAKIAISLTPLDIATAVTDTSGCLPLTAQFSGTSALLSTNYYWFFGDGDSADGSHVNHTFFHTGIYTVVVIAVDTNACSFNDTAYATIRVVNDSVIAGFQLDVLHDCDSNLVINLANQSSGATKYLWTFGDGTSATQFNESHTYTLPGTYTVTLIASDSARCHPADTVSQQVSMLPNATVNFTDSGVCLGQNIQFINESDANAHFIWKFGDNSSSTLFAPQHLYTTAGSFTVQLIIDDSSTCNVLDTVTHTVSVYEQPVAGFVVASDTFQYNKPVTFQNNSTGYAHIFWNFGSGDTATDVNDPVYTYQKFGGVNTCIIAVNNACIDSICKNFFVSFVAKIGVPNAFTPNGDGTNDIVFVEGEGITALTFKIYNRWGEMVFEGHDQAVGWDGTYKGVPQEVDVYTYTVDAEMVNGQSIPLKGNITLLR